MRCSLSTVQPFQRKLCVPAQALRSNANSRSSYQLRQRHKQTMGRYFLYTLLRTMAWNCYDYHMLLALGSKWYSSNHQVRGRLRGGPSLWSHSRRVSQRAQKQLFALRVLFSSFKPWFSSRSCFFSLRCMTKSWSILFKIEDFFLLCLWNGHLLAGQKTQQKNCDWTLINTSTIPLSIPRL